MKTAARHTTAVPSRHTIIFLCSLLTFCPVSDSNRPEYFSVFERTLHYAFLYRMTRLRLTHCCSTCKTLNSELQSSDVHCECLRITCEVISSSVFTSAMCCFTLSHHTDDGDTLLAAVFQGHLNDTDIRCITACLPAELNCSTTVLEGDVVTWWLPEWLWSWHVLLLASSVILLVVLSVIVAYRYAF